jgi:hypothetical protein
MGVWALAAELVKIFFTVKVLYWLLSRMVIPLHRRSPRLGACESTGTELLLRKRIVAMNWKIMANKARALYYTKRVCSRARAVSFDSLDGL